MARNLRNYRGSTFAANRSHDHAQALRERSRVCQARTQLNEVVGCHCVNARAARGGLIAARAVSEDSLGAAAPAALSQPGMDKAQYTTVYKFGGSSVADASRMVEVANIVCSPIFQDEAPIVVLSAMGKTTNNLISAGELAVETKSSAIRALEPLRAVIDLHRETLDALAIDDAACRAEVEELLDDLVQLLTGIALLKDLTPRSMDALVSFGERLSTRIFAGFLRSRGVNAVQHDAFEIGFITTDAFNDGDLLYEESVPKIKQALARYTPPSGAGAEAGGNGEASSSGSGQPCVPIVTGFLGRGEKTGAITTLGRGGSDLTATFIGAALGIEEVVVWKDVDGVLTTDPRVCPDARPVPVLTVAEATELAFFGATVLHPQSMTPLGNCPQDLRVRVRNSYNPAAPGSIICKAREGLAMPRDGAGAGEGAGSAGSAGGATPLLTSIVLKTGVTMLDIVSTRMLGQYGFLSKVFGVFEELQISVDVVGG